MPIRVKSCKQDRAMQVAGLREGMRDHIRRCLARRWALSGCRSMRLATLRRIWQLRLRHNLRLNAYQVVVWCEAPAVVDQIEELLLSSRAVANADGVLRGCRVTVDIRLVAIFDLETLVASDDDEASFGKQSSLIRLSGRLAFQSESLAESR